MASLNLFLSLSAFALGFVVLFAYPFYAGIDRPIDIILTPIALAFICEIDNWLFNVLRQCYQEAQMEKLWEFKGSFFTNPELPYYKSINVVWKFFIFLITLVAGICLVTTVLKVRDDTDDKTSGMVETAFIGGLGAFGILALFACCCIRDICDLGRNLKKREPNKV